MRIHFPEIKYIKATQVLSTFTLNFIRRRQLTFKWSDTLINVKNFKIL